MGARWILVRIAALVGVPLLLLAVSKLMAENLEEYYFSVFISCAIAATLAVSLNLINGITGQFSIGHAGFYAVGAYTGAAWTTLLRPILARSIPALQVGTVAGDATNLAIALVAGTAAAALAGLAVGLPSLRLRGDYLAIVTLGFGEMIRVFVLNIDALGGARGLSDIPTLVSTGGLAAFWVLLVLVAVVALSRNLMQSSRGLTWLAVREDEVAADAMGVNTTQVKVTAFVLGSAFAGAAGVLYGHFYSGISPDVFGMDVSIIITTMVVLAGTGSVTGAIIAAAILTAAPEVLRPLQDYRMVIFSTMLIVIMLTRPQGIFGHGEFGYGTIRHLLRRRRATSAGVGE